MNDPANAIPLERLVAHREWVRRVARALVQDEALADDLEQEVWLEALQRPPGSHRSLGGWLAAAMRHNLLDRRRAEDRRRVREESVARPEAVKSVAELLVEAETQKRVIAAVVDLKEPFRGTILLRYFEDLPLKEVARRQGVPLETVRSRVRTAMSILRRQFHAEDGANGRASLALLLPLVRGSRAVSPEGTAAASIGGFLMGKKIVAACAAMLLLAWAGWRVHGTGDAAPTASPLVATPSTDVAAGTPIPVPPPSVSVPDIDHVPTESPAVHRTEFRLRGSVVDASGIPVPRASIVSGALQPGSDPVREVLAISDDAGEFSVRRQQRPGWVWAEASGHASSAMATVFRGSTMEDSVVLRMQGPAGSIGGVVLGPSSVPVATAKVSVRIPARMGFRFRNAGEEVTGPEALVAPATSDESGRYVVGGLPAGPWEIVVEREGYATVTGEATVAAGEAAVLDFRLSAGAIVFGRLTTPEGEPAAGLRVILVGMERTRDRETRTDGTGEYRFLSVPEGGVILRAMDGRGAIFEGFAGVRDGERRRLDGQLLRRTLVSGRLVDGEGKPLVHWKATLYLRVGARLVGLLTTTTDDDGRFRIDNVPPGDATVGVTKGNTTPAMIGLPGGRSVPIDTGVATGTLIGRLAGAEGARDLRLRMKRRDDPTESWISTSIEGPDRGFRLDLPAGEYVGRVTTSDGGLVEIPSVSVRSGTATDLGIVDMTRRLPVTLVVPPEWTDRGTFTLSRPGTGGARTVVASGNLRHEIAVRLSDGEYVVHVEGPDLRPGETRFTVPLTGSTVEVPIRPSPGGATFQFTLPGHAGEFCWITISDADGSIVFEGLVKVNAEDQAGWGMNVEEGRYTYRVAGWRDFEGELVLTGSPPTGHVRLE